MIRIYKTLLFCLIFSNFSSYVSAQSNDDLTVAINRQLIPLKNLSPDSDFKDLERLKVVLKDKQLIALGEATHGTHEFFLFKHRMLRFLVQQMGIKTFVIEGDFAGTLALNDYVISGKGDVVKAILGTGIIVWNTQEFVDLLNWLKAYNAQQAPANKVKFFGCDAQWGFFAMQFLKDYLSTTNQFTPEMELGLAAMKKYYPALNKNEKSALRNSINSLAAVQFTGMDTAQMALYKHAVRQLQQFLAYLDAKSTFFPAQQSDTRDKFMAENVEWIYNYTGRNKMMIWAHNQHIGKSSGEEGHQRMGMFLAKAFKSDYYAMGFDFYDGTYRGYGNAVRKFIPIEIPAAILTSSGALLSRCSAPNFILDIKSASADPVLAKFFNQMVPTVFIGAELQPGQTPFYYKHKYADAYDAIMYIRNTTASMDVTDN